jgi:uncharacterized damage-inducible protein DinB
MHYQFLIDTYQTEIEKVLSVWSQFHDDDLNQRPRVDDPRGRNAREQFQHQCVSEHGWFASMFGIDAGPALPEDRSRLDFIRHYAEVAMKRLGQLETCDDAWWETPARFFGEPRPRTWIMVRRIAHTAHHRGQQTILLRQLGRALHSTYGPTADTGGLAANGGTVMYPYPSITALIAGEENGGRKAVLSGPGNKSPTELPET